MQSKVIIRCLRKQPVRRVAEGSPFDVRDTLNLFFNERIKPNLPDDLCHAHHPSTSYIGATTKR